MAVALSVIRDRIKRRVDHEHTGEAFVTDAEIFDLINRSYKELFGILVDAGLHSVPETETTISPDGSADYALPTDFYAVQGVFRENNGYFYRLVRHGARIKPYDDLRSDASSYRIHGFGENARIIFSPRPDQGSYTIRYIAAPVDLTSEVQTVDGVLGWEEYLVLDVGIDILLKEGLDPTWMIRRKNEMLARIKKEARNRDLLETHQVGDARWRSTDTLYDDQGYLPGGNRGVLPYYWRF